MRPRRRHSACPDGARPWAAAAAHYRATTSACTPPSTPGTAPTAGGHHPRRPPARRRRRLPPHGHRHLGPTPTSTGAAGVPGPGRAGPSSGASTSTPPDSHMGTAAAPEFFDVHLGHSPWTSRPPRAVVRRVHRAGPSASRSGASPGGAWSSPTTSSTCRPSEAGPPSRRCSAACAPASPRSGVHPAQDTPELRAITTDWPAPVDDLTTSPTPDGLARRARYAGAIPIGYRRLRALSRPADRPLVLASTVPAQRAAVTPETPRSGTDAGERSVSPGGLGRVLGDVDQRAGEMWSSKGGSPAVSLAGRPTERRRRVDLGGVGSRASRRASWKPSVGTWVVMRWSWLGRSNHCSVKGRL